MRSGSQRRSQAIHRLETEANVWLATASPAGVPHLVPLSLAWDGTRVLVATPTDTPSVRNVLATGAVKATLDSADDVVLIEGTAEAVDFASASPKLLELYVKRVGWNPADQDGAWSLLVISPLTVRSWNSVSEITGRTIMRHGVWADTPG